MTLKFSFLLFDWFGETSHESALDLTQVYAKYFVVLTLFKD